ncbi:MAG: FadR family transcriptional regulator [Rubrivivax sp.]|nr:FadR family transcriptional regulator [Rubrivivax sp.]
MQTHPGPEATRSRSQLAEQQLRQAIADGTWPAGARLPTETELAARFGMSRSTLREAVSRLRADGLVDSRPGRGAVVRGAPSLALRLPQAGADASVGHLFELRRLLEVEAAALAAERWDAQALQALEQAHETMAQAAAGGLHAPQADLAFHRAVAAASANPMLLTLLDFVGQHLERLIARAWENSARVAGGAHAAQREHEAVLAAIRDRDPARRARPRRATCRRRRSGWPGWPPRGGARAGRRPAGGALKRRPGEAWTASTCS